MASWLGFANKNSSPAPIWYSGLNVSTSQMDLPKPIFWGQRRLGTNAIWYGHFERHPASGKGKGGGSKGGSFTYTAATICALCEGPLDSIARAWQSGSTTTTSTLIKLNQQLFLGTATQTPWPWIITNDPTFARAYARTAYLASPEQQLGESASIPDNGYECVRANGFAYTPTSPGWIDPATHTQYPAIDCLLSDIITDLFTNPQYGLGFVSGDVGDITQFALYQRAQGFLFSPLLNKGEKGTSILDRWAKLSNSWFYYSGTAFQFVPLGDSAITANGVTYTPDIASAYSLGPADFVGKVPIQVKITAECDAQNKSRVSITDRTIGYVTNPFEWKDQDLIAQYGLRDAGDVSGDDICNPAVATIATQLIGKRNCYIRRTYTFTASYRFIRCLPGTILTLTEPNAGLSAFPVRVTSISEDDKGTLKFQCEEFPGTIGTYTPSGQAGGNVPSEFPNTNADPGTVNTPTIAEPDSSFTGGKAILLICASGSNANYGGCTGYVSFDGTNYQTIGDINNGAQGVLTAALADHVDPDTANTLSVDTTESLTTPPAGITHADADDNRTLSLVCAPPTLIGGAEVLSTAGELLAFGAVTPTGTYTADLTYLRRGRFGSAHSAHNIGDLFTVLDVLGESGTCLSFDLPPQYIGQPIFFKFAAFNVFDGPPQDLSLCTEYQYTPTGAGYGTGADGVPATPTGLAGMPGNGQNLITWSPNPATDNVTSYTLLAAAGLSQPFSAASPIYNGLSTAFQHSGIGNGANFTYFLIANNAIGSSGHTAGVNCTSNASGIGSVTSIAAGTGIVCTPDPITDTGTVSLAATSAQPFLTAWMEGLALDNELIGETVTTQNITFTGYRFAGHADVPPASDAVFNIYARPFGAAVSIVLIAQVTILAGSFDATIAFFPSASVIVPADYVISVNAPSPADPSLANVAFSWTAEPSP